MAKISEFYKKEWNNLLNKYFRLFKMIIVLFVIATIIFTIYFLFRPESANKQIYASIAAIGNTRSSVASEMMVILQNNMVVLLLYCLD